MTNYAYTDNVPASQNNPSVDQPKMKENTRNTKDLIGEDHVTFSANNGGLHKKSRYVDTVGFPTGLLANIGTVYTKKAISVGASLESDLFYVPDTGDPALAPAPLLRDYQLTRTITASYPLFGNITQNYNAAGNTFSAGWTFLPGGMLMQYGFMDVPSPSLIVKFPVAFNNNPFSIQLTARGAAGAGSNFYVNSDSQTQFTIFPSSTFAGISRVYWVAIGV